MTSGASSPSKSCWTSRTGASAAGWAVLIGCWGLVGFGALIWVAARLASGLAGGACESFSFRTKFIADVARGRTVDMSEPKARATRSGPAGLANSARRGGSSGA